jgi:peptide chain release factor 3
VLQSRLETEYGVETTLTNLSYKLARWVDRDVDDVARMSLPSRARVATDHNDLAVVLFTSEWELEYAQKENPGVEFLTAR